MNTPRVVMTDTKKAFRKLSKTNDVQAAANILCNMKGVSPGMASGKLLSSKLRQQLKSKRQSRSTGRSHVPPIPPSVPLSWNKSVRLMFNHQMSFIVAGQVLPPTDESGTHKHAQSSADREPKGFQKAAQCWAGNGNIDQPQRCRHYSGLRWLSCSLMCLCTKVLLLWADGACFWLETPPPHWLFCVCTPSSFLKIRLASFVLVGFLCCLCTTLFVLKCETSSYPTQFWLCTKRWVTPNRNPYLHEHFIIYVH